MTPQELANIFLSLSGAEKAAFLRAAGLASSAHCGSRRTKNPIKASTRALVYARENWRCYWCQVDLVETGADFDHVRRVRGSDPVYLLGVASCPACNNRRSVNPDPAGDQAVAARLAGLDMSEALARRDSPAGREMFRRVKLASGAGRPAGPAVPF